MALALLLPKGREEEERGERPGRLQEGLAVPMPSTHLGFSRGAFGGPLWAYPCPGSHKTTGDGAGGGVGPQQPQGPPSLAWIDSRRAQTRDAQGDRVFPRGTASQGQKNGSSKTNEVH